MPQVTWYSWFCDLRRRSGENKYWSKDLLTIPRPLNLQFHVEWLKMRCIPSRVLTKQPTAQVCYRASLLWQKAGRVRITLLQIISSSHFLMNDVGEFKYAKTIGVRSLKHGKPKPMERNTVLALASCTKLMTAICALQCVERGLLALDQDVTPLLPEVGKYGIITGFDDVTGQPVITPNTKHVTLR